MLVMATLLALLSCALGSASASSGPGVLRFPIEGGGHHTVCGVTCTGDDDDDELLRAQVREVSSTLNIPARNWYGPGGWINDTSLGPWRGGQLQTIELPKPTRVNPSRRTLTIPRSDTTIVGNRRQYLWPRPTE